MVGRLVATAEVSN